MDIVDYLNYTKDLYNQKKKKKKNQQQMNQLKK